MSDGIKQMSEHFDIVGRQCSHCGRRNIEIWNGEGAKKNPVGRIGIIGIDVNSLLLKHVYMRVKMYIYRVWQKEGLLESGWWGTRMSRTRWPAI